jgi:hypothetical protein
MTKQNKKMPIRPLSDTIRPEPASIRPESGEPWHDIDWVQFDRPMPRMDKLQSTERFAVGKNGVKVLTTNARTVYVEFENGDRYCVAYDKVASHAVWDGDLK